MSETELLERVAELVRDIRAPGNGPRTGAATRLVSIRDREIAGDLIALIRELSRTTPRQPEPSPPHGRRPERDDMTDEPLSYTRIEKEDK